MYFGSKMGYARLASTGQGELMSTTSVPAGTTASPDITGDERRLAARNHGFPLEALQYPVTPLGLHYLLIHYDIPVVRPATWTLNIGGRVSSPMRLSIDDLRARPAVTRAVTMECAGNGRMDLEPRALSQPWGVEAVGTGEWTGTPLLGVLREAGLLDDAVEVLFTGLDVGLENGVEQRYERSLTIDEASREDVLLVYALNGQPLLPQHGFPLRLIVPGWYGMTNVKWLSEITAIDKPFEGYQQAHAYRVRNEPDEPGEPLSRMRPRALMTPPGIPDFFTRDRTVAPGPVVLQGRAWSGFGPIETVAVSTNGGETWVDATVADQPDPYAWVEWTYAWEARPGEYELCCRAMDAEGNLQPIEPEWNLGGYACNAVQRVPVAVKAG
jgi:DMSO/TMAO reductase YedYZ molybdopterin-dependent catalytic subunit